MLCFLDNGVRSSDDANHYPRRRDWLNWQTLAVVIISAALIVFAYQ